MIRLPFLRKRKRPRSPIGEKKRDYILLILACLGIYVGTMTAKSAFATELIEIVKYYNIPKATASFTTTLYYITYAAMQFVFAKIINKLDVVAYTAVGAMISAVLIFILPFSSSIKMIWVMFAICGIVQASIWPTCIHLSGKYLDAEYKDKSIVIFSTGTIVSYSVDYFLSGLFVKYLDWKWLFYVTSVFLFVCSLAFFSVLKKIEKKYPDSGEIKAKEKAKEKDPAKSKGSTRKTVGFIIAVSLIAFLYQFVYNSVSNWFPNLLSDVFGTSSSMSLFLSFFVPIVTVVAPYLTLKLSKKYFIWKLSIAYEIILVLLLVFLGVILKLNIAITFTFTILVLILDKGVGNIAVSIAPFEMGKIMTVGSLAAITNGFASMGASLGPLASGYLIDEFGYAAIYIFCAILIFLAVFFSVLANCEHKKLINSVN